MRSEQATQILVVDDEETVRRSIQKRLEKEGYRVIAMDNAADALKVFENMDFDAVLTDIRMGGMDGMAFLERIQDMGRGVPVVMVTGAPTLETAQESVRLGAYDYITKPVQREALLKTVGRAVEQKRLEQRLRAYQRELEERVQEQTRIIRALFHLANQLNSMETLEEVLASVAEGVHRYVRCERIAILLRRDGQDALCFAHGMGISPPGLKDLRVPVSSPVVRALFEADETIRIHEGPLREKALNALGDTPWLGVGLKRLREPFGVLLASERDPAGEFTDGDLQVFSYIGDCASVALYNQMVSRRLRESYLHIIQALAYAIEAKDPYTRGHSERVRGYAVRLARAIGLSEKEVTDVGNGAILHDIGKVEISGYIIQKPERLTEDEYTDMKNHPAIGEVMVSGISFLEAAKQSIRHHHERWDGQGYPDGLDGERIPLGARVIAIADMYDALTTQRPYRNDTSKERAILKLREEKGSHLDPELVERFIAMIQHIG